MTSSEISPLFTANLKFLQDKFSLKVPDDLVSKLFNLQDSVSSEVSIAEFEITKSSFAKVSCPIPSVEIKSNVKFPDYKYSSFHQSTCNNFEIPFRDYSLSKVYGSLSNLSSLEFDDSFITSFVLIGIRSPHFMENLANWCLSNKIRNIAFVDVSLISLISSCFVVDWSKLFNQLLEYGIKSSFFLEDNLADSLSASVNWLSTISYYSGVNFYYYIDRIACPEYIEAAALLSDPSAYFSFIAKGFFEDNINMLYNSINTLSSNGVRFVDFTSIEDLQCPVVLVGSGPSLDVNIDIASNMTDGTFVLLNRDIQCFTSNETGWTNVKG